jgi:hypothetical protein
MSDLIQPAGSRAGQGGAEPSKRVTVTSVKREEKATAKKYLSELLEPGDVITTILTSVNPEGSSRTMRIAVVKPLCWQHDKTPYIRDITRAVAHACGYRESVKDWKGLIAGGGGMDMGFSVVYSIGRVLFPDGVPCTGNPGTCRSNDHHNGDNDYTAGKIHKDGGYAFRAEWLY